jgi:hypothetical protein
MFVAFKLLMPAFDGGDGKALLTQFIGKTRRARCSSRSPAPSGRRSRAGVPGFFILGNTWGNKMSNPKRIGLKERPRRTPAARELSQQSREHRAPSCQWKAAKNAGRLSGEGQAVVRPNSKKSPSFIDSKPASENREGRRMTYAITWAEWVGHADVSMRPHAA